MLEKVHPLALVEEGARLGEGVRVGPFAVVAAGATLGSGCDVGAHAFIAGGTELGEGVSVGVGAVVGGAPQLRGDFAVGRLSIGAKTRIGEHATIHSGSGPEGWTRIGAGCFLMAYVHIGHDCRVGDRTEIANGSQIAGHAEIDEDVIIGGLVAVHQEVHIGRLAMIGGGAKVAQDILPFACASGDRARVYGTNRVGLRRCGLLVTQQDLIRRAVKAMLRRGDHAEALQRVESILGEREPALRDALRDFVQRSSRGLAPLVTQCVDEAE